MTGVSPLLSVARAQFIKHLQGIMFLTNAILRDHRVFHVEDPDTFLDNYDLQGAWCLSCAYARSVSPNLRHFLQCRQRSIQTKRGVP